MLTLTPNRVAEATPPRASRKGDSLPQQFGLGENIADRRRRAGFTQDELGSRLGVSAQAVSKWERNVSCPDIMLLPELARTLGVTLDDLFSPPTSPSGEKHLG